MEHIMETILSQRFDSLQGLYELMKNRKMAEELKESLSHIAKEKLYPSYFHGLHHSEKVLLFSVILGNLCGFDETERQIVRDAAIYHDIGRKDDSEDAFHGLVGASKIETIVTHPIYQIPENMGYLKAIIDGHSQPRSRSGLNFSNYQSLYPMMEEKRYQRLYDVLLDADALDRTRFSKECTAALDEKFLALPFSKELVSLARTVNSIYREMIADYNYTRLKERYFEKNEEQGIFHGIGWDFFKLDHILEAGILSGRLLRQRHLDCGRNFMGNNQDLWVSVVADKDISKNGLAYRRFLKNAISFYGFSRSVAGGVTANSKAYQTGDSICSGEYEDESFVFDKIDRDSLYCIVIPEGFLNNRLDSLSYLSGSINVDSLQNKA